MVMERLWHRANKILMGTRQHLMGTRRAPKKSLVTVSQRHWTDDIRVSRVSRVSGVFRMPRLSREPRVF